MRAYLFIVVVLSLGGNVFSQTAGEVSPTAKIIDADVLSPFRQGTALIQKGEAYALINEKGDIVMPFNTYASMEYRKPMHNRDMPSMTSMYLVYSMKYRYGAIVNSSGKLIYTPPAGCDMLGENTGDGDEGPGHVELRTPFNRVAIIKPVYFNANGDVLKLDYDASWNEGIVTYMDEKTRKFGFRDFKGQLLIAAQFDNASVFSEGMAAVAKKNEFGQLKWGYIDKKAKLVIPYSYTRRPGDFGNGLASVVPVAAEDFSFAYINRHGEIVFKIPKNAPVEEPNVSSGTGTRKFIDGYAFSGSDTYTYYIDTTGKIFSGADLLKAFQLPEGCGIEPEPYYDHQMYYTDVVKTTKKGLLDLHSMKYVPAVFDELSMFDPVTNLAHARILLGYGDHNVEIYQDGYINREGVFVMIKRQPDKF